MPLVPKAPYKMAASRLDPFPTRENKEGKDNTFAPGSAEQGGFASPFILPAKWPKISVRATRYSSSKKFLVHPKNIISYGNNLRSLAIIMNNEKSNIQI